LIFSQIKFWRKFIIYNDTNIDVYEWKLNIDLGDIMKLSMNVMNLRLNESQFSQIKIELTIT